MWFLPLGCGSATAEHPRVPRLLAPSRPATAGLPDQPGRDGRRSATPSSNRRRTSPNPAWSSAWSSTRVSSPSAVRVRGGSWSTAARAAACRSRVPASSVPPTHWAAVQQMFGAEPVGGLVFVRAVVAVIEGASDAVGARRRTRWPAGRPVFVVGGHLVESSGRLPGVPSGALGAVLGCCGGGLDCGGHDVVPFGEGQPPRYCAYRYQCCAYVVQAPASGAIYLC